MGYYKYGIQNYEQTSLEYSGNLKILNIKLVKIKISLTVYTKKKRKRKKETKNEVDYQDSHLAHLSIIDTTLHAMMLQFYYQ